MMDTNVKQILDSIDVEGPVDEEESSEGLGLPKTIEKRLRQSFQIMDNAEALREAKRLWKKEQRGHSFQAKPVCPFLDHPVVEEYCDGSGFIRCRDGGVARCVCNPAYEPFGINGPGAGFGYLSGATYKLDKKKQRWPWDDKDGDYTPKGVDG